MQSIDGGPIISTLLLWLFTKQGYGDSQLSRALNAIAPSSSRYDQPTRDCLARRTAEGRSRREIRRGFKRYLVRDRY